MLLPKIPDKALQVALNENTERFSSATRLLLFCLFVLPLLINPVVTYSFDTVYLLPRLWWLYATVFPTGLLVLMNWVAPWQKLRILVVPLGAWLIWLAFTVIANKAGWAGWWGQADRADGVLMHGLYALILLAAWWWAEHDPAWQSQLTWAVLISGSLVALSNILQQLHLAGVANPNAFSGVAATPFGGTLGNRGYLGGFMALLLPTALWLMHGQPRSQRKWAGLAVTLMAWALLGSFTRGAWVAGFLGCTWWALHTRQSQKSWWPLGLACLLFWATTTVSSHVSSHPRSFSIGGHEGQAVSSTSGRTLLWDSALLGIKRKPMLGWGTPALLQVMNSRPDAQLLSKDGRENIKTYVKLNKGTKTAPIFQVVHTGGQRETVIIGGGVDKVHNEYLDYALTYGLPAAVFFAVLLGTAIWYARWAVPGLSAGLLAYAAYLFTWPEVVRFAPIAWFMMGIALATAKGNGTYESSARVINLWGRLKTLGNPASSSGAGQINR